jgi:hypothetical protein
VSVLPSPRRQRATGVLLRHADRRRLPEELHHFHLQRRSERQLERALRRRPTVYRRHRLRAGSIAITPNAEQGIIADEYSKFMGERRLQHDISGVQNVFTYTIDILPGHTATGPTTPRCSRHGAERQGQVLRRHRHQRHQQIEAALTTIFQEVQAVNSVFASTTLPVSVNVRGTNLNQVYIGVFRPDPNKARAGSAT